MTVRADHDASVAFLRKLRPEGPWELSAIHPTRRNAANGGAEMVTRTLATEGLVRAFLRDHGDWNLYYGVNPTVEPVTKKAEIFEIAEVQYLQVDIDMAPGETPDIAWQRIEPMLSHPPPGLPPPTALVRSGGGANALWKLESPIPITGDHPSTRDACGLDAGGYSYQIRLVLRGADSCHSIDHIFRLPGTVNWPTQKKIEKYGRTEPLLAQLIFWDDSRVYPISKFAKYSPQTAGGTKAAKGGPTRHGFRATSNIERLTASDLDTLDLTRLADIGEDPEQLREIIRTGDAAKWKGDRSRMTLWVTLMLVRAGVADDKIYAILTDPDFPVSGHVLDQNSGMRRYAERQIDRAHDMAIHPKLAEFNERYAAIEDVGGKCAILTEDETGAIEYMQPGSFKDFHCNNFVEIKTRSPDGSKEIVKEVPVGTWWWGHPMRRQFRSVVFEPERTTPGHYNLWRGFGVEPVPGDWSALRQLIEHNICGDDKEYYGYLIRWVAYGLQHPGRPAQTAVVLLGLQGTGKGTFAQAVGSLWGAHFLHMIDGRHLTGQFTEHLRAKKFVFADEAFFAGDHRNVSMLKGLVTEETINIEAKYLRVKTYKNVLQILIASNKEWVINAEASDRRYLVLKTLDIPAAEVEKQRVEIDRQLAAGGRAGFLYDMLHMDLSDWNIRRIPQTQALAVQKELSLAPHEAWWMNALHSGEIAGDTEWEKPILTRLVMESYYLYHQRSRTRSTPLVDSMIGRFLGKVVPEVPGRSLRYSRDGRSYYRFPPLRACREHWNAVMRSPFPWPEEPIQPDQRDAVEYGDPQMEF